MTLNGNTDETNGYNSVIKNSALADANHVKAVIPPIGSILYITNNINVPTVPDAYVDISSTTTISDADSPFNGLTFQANTINSVGSNIGILKWFRFNETTGTTLADSGSDANDGTIITNTNITLGASSPVVGSGEYAIKTQGIGDLITAPIGSLSSINLLTDDFTIAFWWRRSDTPSVTTGTPLWNIGTGLGSNWYLYFQPVMGSNVAITGNVGSTQASIWTKAYSSFTHDTWTHFAIVYDHTQGGFGGYTFYIDGVADNTYNYASSGVVPTSAPAGTTINLLENGASTRQTYMHLDDWRLYNSLLTPTQVSFIYNSGTGSIYEYPFGVGVPYLRIK